MTSTRALVCLVVAFTAFPAPADEPLFPVGETDAPTLQSGRAFEQTLEGSIGLAWQDQHLRDGLHKLSRALQRCS